MKKKWGTILFWGAVWGASEATLGFLFHKAAVAIPGLPGFLLFPVAFLFMRRVWDETQEGAVIFLTACVAASIKLVDFWVPGADAIRIVNPALSILLEGLCVALVLQACRKRGWKPGFRASFLMGVGWRTIFLAYMSLIAFVGLPAGLITGGAVVSLRFLLLESAVNAVLMGAWLWKADGRILPFGLLRNHPAIPILALLLALTAQFLM